MILIYPAKFEKTASGYSVSFPDFGSGGIYAPNLEDAYFRSEILLTDSVNRWKLKGEPLPTPSAATANDGKNEICFFSLIGIESDQDSKPKSYLGQSEDFYNADHFSE